MLLISQYYYNNFEGIEELFPSEVSAIYFIPYDKNGSNTNKGKLYDKYCNIRKTIRKITYNNKPSINNSDTVEDNNFENEGKFPRIG